MNEIIVGAVFICFGIQHLVLLCARLVSRRWLPIVWVVAVFYAPMGVALVLDGLAK